MNYNLAKPFGLFAVFIRLGLPLAHGEPALPDKPAAPGDRVDKLVQNKMHDEQIPGLALAVIKDGKIIKLQSYDFANVEFKIPVTTNTIFRIGSVSKQFIASAIMLLVEEGKLNLDDPVSKYLAGTPPRWKKLTIRHLLTHTSGIPDIVNENIPLAAGARNFDEGVLKAVARRSLHFTPGSEWRYSNSNYHLLGMILGKITGQRYEIFLRERIFDPLAMHLTTVARATGNSPYLATGYDWNNSGLHPVDAPIEVTAGGGIASTILDMAKWDAALYKNSPLQQSSLQQMWTPVHLNDGMTWRYGFGWDVGRINDHLIVSHGGNFAGFSSAIYRAVDDRLTVILLDNRVNSSSALMLLAQKISRIYLWTGPDYQPVLDQEPRITARVRDIAGRCDRGRLREEDFTVAVWAELSPWRKQMQQDGKALGPASSFTLVEHTSEANGQNYRYRIQFNFGTILLHVAFDGQNKIAVWKVEDVDLK